MEVTIQRDGLTLRGILEKPDVEKCPIVIMMHGFTGNLGYKPDSLFQLMTEKLVEQGVATIRFDFNGHGKSDGTLEEMNVFNEICDGIAIIEYTRKLPFVTDIYLAGHSQGGVVSSMLAGYYDDVIQGLTLMAPAATLKNDAIKGTLMGNSYDAVNIPDLITFGPAGDQHAIGGHYVRIAQLLPIYETAAVYERPVCVIHGLDDFIVHPDASRHYHEVYKNSQLHLIEGENHNLTVHTDEVIQIATDFFMDLINH